ncbi:hypothetical protein Pmar_PMAR005915 [Perkinsus marinus ATCC 50983]|uniref:Uncharacterized protein n=1 Tax=Perkinsus marinus (strain ATCC 50983 / TXsc) TaxID=423536 RepID=C5LL10_PERM5|nr:hypothetical protein Pmar_PMAR005915 [Perkinsus marinus ATCC 50983]EER02574.1 hypothetical protein Pmar_PMAR005915 [Perkinsus marinus ATCC 50983]|eukprot:XP_002769856.1 hypothetical protein Pmar_PMAR005915 [Perkinsus marinus ATCC 50983]
MCIFKTHFDSESANIDFDETAENIWGRCDSYAIAKTKPGDGQPRNHTSNNFNRE